MRSPLALLSLALLALASPAPLRAQCLDWSPGFALPGGGVGGGEVFAMTVFDDGSGPALYVAGSFVTAGDVPARGIARWDGASWSALGSGLAGVANALTVFDDGGGPALFVGGDFLTAGGVPARNLASWDGSGWSTLGGGIQTGTSVLALAVHDDGGGPALYAAGMFLGVTRWSGSAWTSISPATSVWALLSFDDGSGPALYAGGPFSSLGAGQMNSIARWDGAAWHALGTGLGGWVNTMTAFDDGQGPALYVGGNISSAGGQPAARVARWRNAAWSALGSGLPDLTVVESLVVHAGLLHAAGWNGSGLLDPPNVLSWDGTAWTPLGDALSREVHALAVYDAGAGPELHAGGYFQLAGTSGAGNLAKWGGAGWAPVASGPGQQGTTSAVFCFASYDDGGGPALYAGGWYEAAGGALANSIARWDGTSWQPVGGGVTNLTFGYTGVVRALAVHDDGSGPGLYAAGTFSAAGGVPAANVARWDGTSWSPLGAGIAGPVYALAVYDDGSGPGLYAGGEFLSAGGIGAKYVARWDGVNWSPLGSGTTHGVRTLHVWDDGNGPALYVGGVFLGAGGLFAEHIARYRGTTWSAVGTGIAGNSVTALASLDDGSGPALYATGDFTHAGGVVANGIARWDGATWSALGGAWHGTALAAFDDGAGPALYLGDDQGTLGFIRKYSASAATWTTLGGGVDGPVLALAAFDDQTSGGPDLYLGGGFHLAGSIASHGVAKWRGCAGPGVQFCSGGGPTACPCGNAGAPGHGCQNSAATGGAVLGSAGATSPDTVVLAAFGELPTALSIFLQGDQQIAPVAFGDGLRCVGGGLRRLYAKNASGGVAVAPEAGEDPITVRSAALGDPLAPGDVRVYQVYYRDPALAFCPAPQGDAWNVTNALRITW